ncbi:MAG: orotate phosphoribosyltransferase [Deltaproteobacteria bacterium]|nr:orotate phosphoribosyltransferase [Deltaproteobacteria bacterium]
MSSVVSPLEEAYQRQRSRLFDLMRSLSFERRQVILSSGKSSDFYIDSKQSVLTAEGHFLVGQLFYSLLERHAPQALAVGGLTMGADPLASATSLVSYLAGRPRAAFYVRKEPKEHGTAQWIEGVKNLPQGTPVVIVEDVITTGASTLRAIERARLHSLEVVHVLALVDREEESGREAVEREARVTALFTRRDFMGPGKE